MSSRKRKTAAKRVKSKRGSRYTPKQKAEVISFVHAYNKKHGRGGQSQAVKKFGVTALTIATWLKSPSIGSKAVNENASLGFTVTATDADGDTLSYSASSGPS